MKKIFILLILITIALIGFLLGLIYYIDNANNLPTNSNKTSNIESKINSLASNNKIDESGYFQRMKNKIKLLNDSTLSKKDKYNELVSAEFFLVALYSDTNDPRLYKLQEDFKDLAKNNYKEYYQEKDFIPTCMDSSCADAPQPEEILKIVKAIKASDINEDDKIYLSRDILNIGYTSVKERDDRAQGYLIMASIVQKTESTNKDNLKISEELYNYIKKEYPDQYKKYASIDIKNINPTIVNK